MSTEMRQEVVIEPGRAEAHYWRDLWRYKRSDERTSG